MKKKVAIGIVGMLAIVSMLLLGIIGWKLYQKYSGQDVLVENNSQGMDMTESIQEEESEGIVQEEIPAPDMEKKKIHLMMTGDNLMHLSIVNSGVQADGTRNYDMLFEPIKEYLEMADIKIANQETILGGNELGFSAFPRFNSPTELGDSLVSVGYNVVLHATNHAADKGIEGINNCLDFWEKYPDVLVTGIFKEVDEPNQDIGLITVDGVTFAILNYTYSPNLSALPKWLQGHLGMLCDWDENTGMIDFRTIHPDVLTDIAKAKEMADVVVVCPHWGNEYTFVPSIYQKTFAKQMTEAGADLIIGTHPHVIQPVEWVVGENGNRALCYYSLGNYVSTQYKPTTMLEAMAWVTFEVNGETIKILEEETGAIPMVYQFAPGHSYENVYFLDEYTEELAQAHGIQVHGESGLSLANLQKWSKEVLGEWVLSSEDALKEKITHEMWK